MGEEQFSWCLFLFLKKLKWNILLEPGNFSTSSAKTLAERVSNYNLITKGNKITRTNDKTPITDKYPDEVKGSTTTNDRKKQS